MSADIGDSSGPVFNFWEKGDESNNGSVRYRNYKLVVYDYHYTDDDWEYDEDGIKSSKQKRATDLRITLKAPEFGKFYGEGVALLFDLYLADKPLMFRLNLSGNITVEARVFDITSKKITLEVEKPCRELWLRDVLM